MSSSSEMLMMERLFTETSCERYPMEEKTSMSLLLGTSITYLPSRSVVVPVLLPFITIVTPGKVSPLAWDVTVPDTVTGMSSAHAILVTEHCSQKPSKISLATLNHGKGLHFIGIGFIKNKFRIKCL